MKKLCKYCDSTTESCNNIEAETCPNIDLGEECIAVKSKESWSREEVEDLLRDIAIDANWKSDFSFDANKWIEDNL